MKYSKEAQRVFVPYQYDELTTENIKEACKTFFCDHHFLCVILASEWVLLIPESTKSHTSKYCIFDLLVFDSSQVEYLCQHIFSIHLQTRSIKNTKVQTSSHYFKFSSFTQKSGNKIANQKSVDFSHVRAWRTSKERETGRRYHNREF